MSVDSTHIHWYGVFCLFSKNQSQKIEIQSEKLASLLELHNQYFVSRYSSKLNPIINFGLLSEKSIMVLNLMASGKRIDAIAKELFLTERGVSYHIDKLKEVMSCSNRSQLIDKAHRLGVL
ncbi:response regulator transcription factor [Ferrimonas aestuarii]|uniref:Response regulator transcription factor n=1 Tax=Ferrimonas aestuarii TaxID=2569539 RepID=A0A4U1BXA2_9GAMM|nr:response regulator transcription factor [Ferrimonas aestuarii]